MKKKQLESQPVVVPAFTPEQLKIIGEMIDERINQISIDENEYKDYYSKWSEIALRYKNDKISKIELKKDN